jgi:hypothetical protein
VFGACQLSAAKRGRLRAGTAALRRADGLCAYIQHVQVMYDTRGAPTGGRSLIASALASHQVRRRITPPLR